LTKNNPRWRRQEPTYSKREDDRALFLTRRLKGLFAEVVLALAQPLRRPYQSVRKVCLQEAAQFLFRPPQAQLSKSKVYYEKDSVHRLYLPGDESMGFSDFEISDSEIDVFLFLRRHVQVCDLKPQVFRVHRYVV